MSGSLIECNVYGTVCVSATDDLIIRKSRKLPKNSETVIITLKF